MELARYFPATVRLSALSSAVWQHIPTTCHCGREWLWNTSACTIGSVPLRS